MPNTKDQTTETTPGRGQRTCAACGRGGVRLYRQFGSFEDSGIFCKLHIPEDKRGLFIGVYEYPDGAIHMTADTTQDAFAYWNSLPEAAEAPTAFKVGDKVQKTGGDYRFPGVVRSVFSKGSGEIRYVVENREGILHIFSEKNLEARQSSGSDPGDDPDYAGA